jgi:hypothetical protein
MLYLYFVIGLCRRTYRLRRLALVVSLVICCVFATRYLGIIIYLPNAEPVRGSDQSVDKAEVESGFDTGYNGNEADPEDEVLKINGRIMRELLAPQVTVIW